MGLDMGLRLSLMRPGGLETADIAGGHGQGRNKDPGDVAVASNAANPPKDTTMEAANVKPPRQYVHNLIVVRGIPMYGYHPNERLFIKVMLYNPQHIGRASVLLQSGSVLGLRLQPYEAHVPFLLQVKVSQLLSPYSALSFILPQLL